MGCSVPPHSFLFFQIGVTMSIKISAFTAAIPAPLTKRDITMVWPNLPQSMFLVQSLTFPTEQYAKVEVPVRGVSVQLPTQVFQSGDWSFEVPDSRFTAVRYEIERAYYEQRLHNIHLIMGDVSNVLNIGSGASFFSNLLNVASAAASTLLTACTLCDAFITDIDPVQFSVAGSAGDPVLWSVKVHYTYITKLTNVG